MAVSGELRDLMVKRLEAQERASLRMIERAIHYSVFSLAILGLYVGVLFASAEPISDVLLFGTVVQVAAFAVVLVMLVLLHHGDRLYVLPDPRDLASQDDAAAIADSVIEAFESNKGTVNADATIARSMLWLALIQGVAFMFFTVIEILDRA